jgi:hypothetical protein
MKSKTIFFKNKFSLLSAIKKTAELDSTKGLDPNVALKLSDPQH